MPGLVMKRFQNGRSGCPGFHVWMMVKYCLHIILMVALVALISGGPAVADDSTIDPLKPIDKHIETRTYFIDNLSLEIPSSLDVFYDAISVPISPEAAVILYEHKFSNPGNTDNEFETTCQERLEYELRNKDDATIVSAKELDKIKTDHQSYLIANMSQGHDGSSANCYIRLVMLLKLPSGYLEFWWPAIASDVYPLDAQANLDKFYQEGENDFVSWVKNFMLNYRWVGESSVSSGQNYRTRLGVIEKEYEQLPVSSSIYVSYPLLLNEDIKEYLGDWFTISSGLQAADQSIYRSLLANFFHYSQLGSSAKPVITLRYVAGRRGLEMKYIDPEVKTGQLAWLELIDQASPVRAPLAVNYHISSLAHKSNRDKRETRWQEALKQWDALIDSVQVVP